MAYNSKHKTIHLLNINGDEYKGDRKEFCEKYNIRMNSLYRVLCGQRSHLYGWHLPTTDMSKKSSEPSVRRYRGHYHENAKLRVLNVIIDTDHPNIKELYRVRYPSLWLVVDDDGNKVKTFKNRNMCEDYLKK